MNRKRPGRMVLPALDSLVSAAFTPFPRLVMCPAPGPGCGPLGVAHNRDEAAVLGMHRDAHQKCCNAVRDRESTSPRG